MEKSYSYARDAFIYLLSYATLLIFTIALNFLIKALTNRVIPDVTEVGGFLHDDRSIIGFLAAIIIAFPIFLFINLKANKMLADGEMRANTGVRHWLIYITLVIVILIIIWQLIALFMSFLQGEVVSRFLLGTVITLFIATSVLAYQWWHLRFFAKDNILSVSFRIFEWVAIALVVGIVAWAFTGIGSPAEQRAKRFDEMRVERLRGIQWAVDDFYGFKDNVNFGRLPFNLDELKISDRFFIEEKSLLDPRTGEMFEYRMVNATEYELCATFETADTADSQSQIFMPKLPTREFSKVVFPFDHGVGRTCFDLSVR